MARRKVQLAYIVNASERKASYKKRKKGLIKKVSELSILCEVEACAIIYSPYDQAEPEVWPSQLGAQAVLSRLNSLPEVYRTRKMFNQESYTRMRIKKAEDQLTRLRRENKRMMLENFLYQCATGVAIFDSFDLRNTMEMQLVISEVLQDLDSRMKAMRKAGNVPRPLPPLLPPQLDRADPSSDVPSHDAGPSSALVVVTQAPAVCDAAPSLTTMSQVASIYQPDPSYTVMSRAGPLYLPGPSFAEDMSQPAHPYQAGPSFSEPLLGVWSSSSFEAMNQGRPPFEARPSATQVVSSQALITPPPPIEMEVQPWPSVQNLLDGFPFNLLQSPFGSGFELDDGIPYWATASADTIPMALDPAPFDINNNFSYAAGSGPMDPGRLVWDDQHILPSHVDFNFGNTPPPPPPPPAAAAVASTTVDATVTPHGLQPNNNSNLS